MLAALLALVESYPNASRLLITADSGGSNGYRTRLWKTELGNLAAEAGLTITVCHLPPGTSNWNKSEHRLLPNLVKDVLAAYRASVREELRHLLDHFSLVDWVRQVVGVGSVGMRVYLVLLDTRAGDDPLFLQVKQAGPSVYEAALGPSPYANHGERVVTGKRMIQSATDIFAGWTSVGEADFYVRQFRNMKIIPDSESIAPRLVTFARKCGAVLARAHARTGDPIAISAYIGKGGRFDEAMGAFVHAYADQTERDQRQLADAIASGAVPGES